MMRIAPGGRRWRTIIERLLGDIARPSITSNPGFFDDSTLN